MYIYIYSRDNKESFNNLNKKISEKIKIIKKKKSYLEKLWEFFFFLILFSLWAQNVED